MKAYSIDLRKRVLAAWQAGEGTQKALAARFRVTDRWIRKLIRQYEQEGHIRPKQQGGYKQPALDASARAKLKQKVEHEPDLGLEQLKQWAKDELGIVCSIMAVDRALKKEKLTFKKNAQGRRTRST